MIIRFWKLILIFISYCRGNKILFAMSQDLLNVSSRHNDVYPMSQGTFLPNNHRRIEHTPFFLSSLERSSYTGLYSVDVVNQFSVDTSDWMGNMFFSFSWRIKLHFTASLWLCRIYTGIWNADRHQR